MRIIVILTAHVL